MPGIEPVRLLREKSLQIRKVAHKEQFIACKNEH
jgi:hypothetical protein